MAGELGNLLRNQMPQSSGQGMPQIPQMNTQQMQIPQAPQMQMPMQGGQGTGLSRYGYQFQPYTPPAQYTPQTFRPAMQWQPIAPMVAQKIQQQKIQAQQSEWQPGSLSGD